MGRFARVRHPWVRDASVAVWRLFADLDLSDAAEEPRASLRDVFVRALKPGARPLHPDRRWMLSPCDGIVGAYGTVTEGLLLQAKGMPYALADLLGDAETARSLEGGTYVTLRLTSAMYHRFHAPHDGIVTDVRHIDGDTWNVNPIALARVRRLFCRNERAAIRLRLHSPPGDLWLIPIAAILVSGLRIHGIEPTLHAGWRGQTRFMLDRPVRRGEELGWFEHGSTILVLVPRCLALSPGVQPGSRIRMGEPLMDLGSGERT